MPATTSRLKLKTAFKIARSIAPLHTSGPVAMTSDGTKIVTCVAEEALMTDVLTSTEICRFAGDTQPITALCISPSSQHLLIFTSSLSLRIYQIPTSTTSGRVVIQPTRVVSRAHEAPVHVCKADPTSTYLASGAADGVVKVWDILRGYVTHVFKGHGGVVSALAFNYPQDPSSVVRQQQMQLITASVDTRIRIFDLSAVALRGADALRPVAVLEGHVSVPRGLDVTSDGRWLVSGGRDSVVLIWDLLSKEQITQTKRGKSKGKHTEIHPALAKTIPALERVEAVGFIQQDRELSGSSPALHLYTGGEKGALTIWDGREGTILFKLGEEQNTISDDQEEQRQILDVIYLPSISTIVSIHADQNILFHSLSTQTLTRQFIGFNDEIIDAVFLSQSLEPVTPNVDTCIALATNSSLIRVYSTSTFDARLLSGHKEIVLCLDHGAGGRVLASGSKDRSARLWAALKLSPECQVEGYSWGWGCVGVCEGHAESVGAIAMSRKAGSDGEDGGHPRFMFTGSQDRTIKMWDLSGVPLTCEESDIERETAVVQCRSLTTHKAHEKDINALDVAPNDRLLTSGSQDRTAKVYEVEYFPAGKGKSARGEVRLLGTCKGHKRGVWSVKFSRTERVLATGSGDKTVKLWNLEDFACIKTFEGHTNSVLRVDFLNDGMQLVSAASDGLVKLWNVRDEECVATMDNHQDKVWALAVSRDERTIVSGAADSIVTFWEDCTEEQAEQKEAKRAEMVLKEQDFVNYVSLHDYQKAIELALGMGQPGRLLALFKDIRSSEPGSITGHTSVDQVIRTLSGSDLARLLRYVRDWNANAKTSCVAQGLLYAVVKLRPVEDVMGAFGVEGTLAALSNGSTDEPPGVAAGTGAGSTALKDLVEALIPYTERHLSRMERLVQESYVVDYILGEMDDGLFDGAEGLMDVDTGIGVVT